jgi:hypothetical protein
MISTCVRTRRATRFGNVHSESVEPQVLEEDGEGAHEPGAECDGENEEEVADGILRLELRRVGRERNPEQDAHQQ